ncbi:udp-n-acetylglucosamine 1-carboxyvinyltransferase [Lasius niger]|uniref:Udp-n-acetylglucosamine 1-carboxyvinyltransferase n=1 Tax=Lasius niger TaxID=67767 RepID=A0A0J7NN14_LASNI|nr:udp-n-acetylglucosamine 1-carboxyvinyltransferase [Lasius niger]
MAVRNYVHQYTMRLTDEKIIDENVSENSDMEDYYPLIRHTVRRVRVNARRREEGTGWDETIVFTDKPYFVKNEDYKSLQSLGK